MSPSAYDSLAREVSARNAERHEAALARLAADGYVVEEDAVRVATLHDTAPCRAGAEASEATPSETGEPPTAVISVVTPERPNAAAARRDPRVARECVHVLRADGARRTDV
jgi:hypothetical protein